MDEGDEVLDGYVAGVEGRRDDESELSGIKNAVRATMSFRDRFVFYIRECPAKESCSDAVWNKNTSLGRSTHQMGHAQCASNI